MRSLVLVKLFYFVFTVCGKAAAQQKPPSAFRENIKIMKLECENTHLKRDNEMLEKENARLGEERKKMKAEYKYFVQFLRFFLKLCL